MANKQMTKAKAFEIMRQSLQKLADLGFQTAQEALDATQDVEPERSAVLLGYISTYALNDLRAGEHNVSASVRITPDGVWKNPIHVLVSEPVEPIREVPKVIKPLSRDLDGNLIKPPAKCIHCKKPKTDHRAKTFECPWGRKHRSMGYSSYGNTVFTVKEKK